MWKGVLLNYSESRDNCSSAQKRAEQWIPALRQAGSWRKENIPHTKMKDNRIKEEGITWLQAPEASDASESKRLSYSIFHMDKKPLPS